ncbi:MAG: tyrosine-type recombinase/integrase family protein [Lachnospiraceae bacterium]|nr:tyrosine-type recombinase/integrase family protein [Lachnospiraceae bacterium]
MQKSDKDIHKTNNTTDMLERALSDVAEHWIEEKKGTVAESSVDRYCMLLECYILPNMGSMIVKDITEHEIEELLKNLSKDSPKGMNVISGSTVMSVRSAIRSIIIYARKCSEPSVEQTEGSRTISVPLNTDEITKVCVAAKHNCSPDMLAVLLSLYCGLKTGELAALNCDDINPITRQIHVHNTMVRVKNRDKESNKKTELKVIEISRKTQIRTVGYPEELDDYIKKFYVEGKMLLRQGDGLFMDQRTLQNHVEQIFQLYKLKNITFRRLAATYQAGMADRKILRDIFTSNARKRPYDHEFDPKWLLREMTNDLASLRLLVGLSKEDISDVTGIPVAEYKQLESGSEQMKWDQFMAILFFYKYNEKTARIIDQLGLYPEALQEQIKLESAG